MNVLLLLFILPIRSLPQSPCNRVKILDQFYERKILWSHHGRPYNLNIHKSTNTLFFSYSETYSDTDFQLASLNIDTGDFLSIAGIKGGCTVAIDNLNDVIYLGGSDGIYKYNIQTHLADFYKEKGKNIWSLFFEKNLFYISYPEQTLHLEIDGNFAVVKEFDKFEIDHFYVTSRNDIFFANKTGIYKYDREKCYVETINELTAVRQMVEDAEGNLYMCTNVGIYVYTNNELKKLLDMKNIYGLTFDRDNNFILSNGDGIIMLKPSEVGCDKGEHW